MHEHKTERDNDKLVNSVRGLILIFFFSIYRKRTKTGTEKFIKVKKKNVATSKTRGSVWEISRAFGFCEILERIL